MLASEGDVFGRLGRDLTTSESARVCALLEDASAVVIGYCGTDFEPAPYPAAVVGVVAKMVARVLVRGSGAGALVTQETSGPFSTTYGAQASAGDVWLTAADKLALRPYRRGVTSIELVSSQGSRRANDDFDAGPP